MIGGIPGREIGVVNGGKLGMPGILGGAGAGIVVPVKMGGGGSAKSVEEAA